MSQCHKIKRWTTDEAFQEQCFLWEGGASVGADFDLIDFQDLFQEPIKREKKKQQKRHSRSRFKVTTLPE